MINIQSSDVEIDLKGYSIVSTSGNKAFSGEGVNISIRNGVVQNFGTAANLYESLNRSDGRLLIEDLTTKGSNAYTFWRRY